MNNDPNAASQHMWADVVYMREINQFDAMSPDELLKLGMLSYVYKSVDVTLHSFAKYDEREKTSLFQDSMRSLAGST